jgi:ABC-type transport system involved in multi-copper enzyme maturation permease subunit
MSGFLRADWIRFRHRRDVLIVALAVPVLALVGYVNGVLNSGSQFGFDPEFPPPPELLAAMAAERQRFAFPQSILTLLGSSSIGLLALIYLAAATVGDEFGWSTIRLSFLASSDRVRFLASRFVALAVVSAWIIGSLVVLGAALPLLAGALGADLPPAPAIDPLGTLGYVASILLVASAALAFGVVVALITRSGPAALVVAVIYSLGEAAFGGLPVWQREDALGWLPTVLFTRAASTLLDQTNRAAAAVRPFEAFAGDVPTDQPQPHILPIHLGILVVAAWGVFFAGAAFLRIRRMDIAE